MLVGVHLPTTLRYGLSDDVLTHGAQAVVDDLAAFKRLGVRHVLIECPGAGLAGSSGGGSEAGR